MKLFSRPAATEILREQGVILSDSALADLAAAGRGPRYVVIHNRALYALEELMAWVKTSTRPPLRERRKLEARTGGKPRYSRR